MAIMQEKNSGRNMGWSYNRFWSWIFERYSNYEYDTKMFVRVYVSGTTQTGIPIKLKIENSQDPTQSVETDTYTTVAGNGK